LKDGLENIDEVFKQAFDGFESNVDPSVWSNVQHSISSGSGGSSTPQVEPSTVSGIVGKSIALKIITGVIAVGTIGAGAYLAPDFFEANENVVVENIAIENNVVSEKVDEAEVVKENTKEEATIVHETIIEESTVSVESNTEEVQESIIIEEVSSQPEVKSSETEVKAVVSEASVKSDEAEVNEQKENQQEKIEETASQIEEEIIQEPTPIKKEAVVGVIPNVITPNGDGENDIIKITGEDLEAIEIFIMDVNGKMVFQFQSLDDVWNGKDKEGNDLLPGSYYMAGSVVDSYGNTKAIKTIVRLFK